MPILIYKEKFNGDELHLAFDCKYNSKMSLVTKKGDYFDSGDYTLLIKNTINDLSKIILDEYLQKNNGVYYMAILNYLVDKIPGVFSVKFITSSSESIYYADELK